ncbi:MAG: RNA 2'-phosphotransferase [Myxococcota bacterium]
MIRVLQTLLKFVWERVCDRYGDRYGREDLQSVLEGDQDQKKRFERVGKKIRAFYGHSRIRTVEYMPVSPTQNLFHGTTPKALGLIREQGLLSMQRQYVHLSIDFDLAWTVAKRYTSAPLILSVRAQEACEAGVSFFQPDEIHFLSETIPPRFLVFPS